jgi:hypothetical protein
MTTKIVTVAHIPQGLEHEWLQHLRDFDTAHPGCHFKVLADTTATEAEVTEMLNKITPGFRYTTNIKK